MTTWKRIAVGLLALASVLGGCLGNDKDKDDQPDVLPPASSLSVAQYAILPPEETWVTASDGQRLHNAVYRPDTDEAVPVSSISAPTGATPPSPRATPSANT